MTHITGRTRRTKEEMEDLIGKMKELEALGKSRKEIALELGCTQAQVTRGLGPVRVWMGRRLAA